MTVAQNCRCLRRKVDEFLDGLTCATFGTRLEEFADGYQRDNHARRLEVKVAAVFVDERNVARAETLTDSEQRERSENRRRH